MVHIEVEPCVPDLRVPRFHRFEFLGRDHLEGCREEDGFLLGHKVAQIGDDGLLPCDEGVIVVSAQQGARVADLVAHVIVERPHRRRGAREPFLLEHGIQLHLFTGKVAFDLHESIVQLYPLVLDERVLNQILDLEQNLLACLVFLHIPRKRMVGGQPLHAGLEDSLEQCELALDVFLAALVGILLGEHLLGEGDLCRRAGSNAFFEHGACLVERELAVLVILFDANHQLDLRHVHLAEMLLHIFHAAYPFRNGISLS